jgi:6,7-dimethyl-8-ribityllumazine synthase
MSTWKRTANGPQVDVGRVFEGKLDASNLRFGIVVARFNDTITGELLLGATEAFVDRGVSVEDIDVAWVPGAFELPLVAKKMAQTGRYDAVVCLGAVIRGETAHFDFVAGEASSGIARAGLDTETPILFGVLTTETMEQAEQRSGRAAGNKGAETAIAAIEMANLLVSLEG